MTEAQRIVIALHGRWHGRYGVACCPAHDDRRPSLTLADGDAGRLLAHCKTGCSFADVIGALRSLGLVEGRGKIRKSDQAEFLRLRDARQIESRKKEQQARVIWNESQPIHGTLAEAYLRGRAITCVLPDTLRFHPACWHPTAIRLPAMVAIVEGAQGFALHRTYLRPDGMGKSGIEPTRAMLGTVAGGAVRLSMGQGTLVVAEGIETALSLTSGLLRAPASVWAALSTSGMSRLRLPKRILGSLTIATDGDVPGKAAGHALAERAVALGWSVRILSAPNGGDWNDILVMKGATA